MSAEKPAAAPAAAAAPVAAPAQPAAAATAPAPAAEAEEEDDALRAAFLRYDTNGDGHVSADEFRAVMSAMLDADEVERLIKEKDRDGDGRITYEEFIRAGEE
ncbi:hypothetical protein DFJ74DRAFT_695070 [Hyaloraphidium curvatum]|nr:hypothetical protein DFJ74DRAFT_695070 [Hyaloraphidium curvatum]